MTGLEGEDKEAAYVLRPLSESFKTLSLLPMLLALGRPVASMTSKSSIFSVILAKRLSARLRDLRPNLQTALG